MKIMNEEKKESRLEKVHIHWNMLPKYCTNCKVQGHKEEECRILHLYLKRKITPIEEEGTKTD